MSKQKTWPRQAYSELAIERGIVERTRGQIQLLDVEPLEERLVVRGRASSFHLKQLAIQGILNVLGDDRSNAMEIDVQITVKRPMAEASVD